VLAPADAPNSDKLPSHAAPPRVALAYPDPPTLPEGVYPRDEQRLIRFVFTWVPRSPCPPLAHGRTRLEPVFVGDVAEAVALLAERSVPLPTYEFGGAHVYTYRELVEAIARTLSLRRYLVSVPFPVWKAMAIAAQSLPGQGLTLNQVELMEQDNQILFGTTGTLSGLNAGEYSSPAPAL